MCAVEGLGFKVVSNWIASGLHTALPSKKNGLTQAKFDVIQPPCALSGAGVICGSSSMAPEVLSLNRKP